MKKNSYIISDVIESPKTGGEVNTKKVIDFLRSKGLTLDVVTMKDIIGCVNYKNYFLVNVRFCYHLLFKKKSGDMIIEDFYMHPWLFLFNWVIRMITKKRIIIFVQSLYYDFQKNNILTLLDKIISSIFLRSAHVVIANSQTVAKECRKLGVKRKVEVVFPGCDFVNELVVRKSHDSSGIRILAVSNYIPRKGFHDLIIAIAFIKSRYPDCYEKLSVQIAGDPNDMPDYTTRLEVLICNNNLEDKVKLLGWKSRTELQALLLSADVFAFTGIKEAYGMVMAEAMYYGLPIIAFNSGSVPELVKNMYNGLLVASNDTEGLAQAIVRLASDSKLRIFMGQNSKKRSTRFVHSWDKTLMAFYKIITETRE